VTRVPLLRKAAFLAALVAAGPACAHGQGPQPYFGGREYPDPYIWDGWAGDGGYRGRAYYAATSPYLTRRYWPFYAVHEHRWSVADDIEALARD
jgi:hypothetical protein